MVSGCDFLEWQKREQEYPTKRLQLRTYLERILGGDFDKSDIKAFVEILEKACISEKGAKDERFMDNFDRLLSDCKAAYEGGLGVPMIPSGRLLLASHEPNNLQNSKTSQYLKRAPS